MIKSIIKNERSTLKNTKHFVMGVAFLSLASAFTGCKKDEVKPVIENKAIIAVSSPADGSSQISGSSVNLAFTASTDNGLKRIVVKYKSSAGIETTKLDSVLVAQPNAFSFSRNYTVGAVGTETYTITVTDKKDNVETKSVNVKSITGFGNEVFGKYYHILGSNSGAFDLVKGEQRINADSDNDKDIVNTDATTVFTGGWVAKNATLYVKALGFNYNSGNINEAKTAYAAGVPNATVTSPANGDIYISKLRGTDVYAVIKIIANETLNDECGCTNKGKLTFTYKKSL